MILQPLRERPTLYTNIHTTLTSLFKKYFLNNSVHQNKVRTPFNPEILPSSTPRVSQTTISSQGVPTLPVDSLRSFCHDRLYMNMRSIYLHTNRNMEYVVISFDIQLSKHYAANSYATRK